MKLLLEVFKYMLLWYFLGLFAVLMCVKPLSTESLAYFTAGFLSSFLFLTAGFYVIYVYTSNKKDSP